MKRGPAEGASGVGESSPAEHPQSAGEEIRGEQDEETSAGQDDAAVDGVVHQPPPRGRHERQGAVPEEIREDVPEVECCQPNEPELQGEQDVARAHGRPPQEPVRPGHRGQNPCHHGSEPGRLLSCRGEGDLLLQDIVAHPDPHPEKHQASQQANHSDDSVLLEHMGEAQGQERDQGDLGDGMA